MQKLKKEPNFFEKRGATTTPPPKGKILMPGGAGGRAKKFTGKFNFDQIKKKFDATGKLDLEDFNNTADLGLFLDWYNNGIKDKNKKWADSEILEISKFLVKTMTQKNIVIDLPKKDI